MNRHIGLKYYISLDQGCIYVDSHRNLRCNLGQLRIKSQIDSQLCESKKSKKVAIKKGKFTWISPKEMTDFTISLYLIINDLRRFSRTTVTFKMLSIVMWYLFREAVKNVRINLGQLRIKRQIDSQLCDSICAAYVQACFQHISIAWHCSMSILNVYWFRNLISYFKRLELSIILIILWLFRVHVF